MESGPSTNPVDGMPRDWARKQRQELQKATEEKLLQDQAHYLNIAMSDEGKRLLTLVSDQLEKRIEALVAGDPEASAYKTILSEMGYKHRLARQAVEKLYKRKLMEERDMHT
jgi:hypothetical protein